MTIHQALLIPLFMSIAYGQIPHVEIRLTKFANAEGIEQLAFYSLMRDKLGFLWFGTQTGLVRFDGHQFKTYRHDPGNPNSLSSNYVLMLKERPDGSLLVIQQQGVDIYDPKTESFSSMSRLTKGSQVELLGKDTWLASHEGLFLLNQEGQFLQVLSENIRFMAKAQTNQLCFVANSGCYLFDAVQRTLNPIAGLESIEATQVNGLAISGDSLWLIMADHRLLQLDIQTRNLTTLYIFPDLGKSKFLTGAKHLWLTSPNGLYRIEKSSGKIEQLVNEVHNEALLAIYSIFEDDDGLVWIGCSGQGLFLFDSNTLKMGHFNKNAYNKDTFTSNIIRAMATDKAGTLWLGMPTGLISMDVDKGTFKDRTAEIFPGFESVLVGSLFFDDLGRLWGTALSHKVFCHDFAAAHTTFYPSPNSIPNSFLNSLLLRKNGQLWVSTSLAGVYYQDATGKTLKEFPVGNQVGEIKGRGTLVLLEDHQQRLWMTSYDGGLFRFEDETQRFQQFNKALNGLSNDLVVCLFEDNRHRLWVGTGQGLNLLLADGSFRSYTKKEGLPDDTIYAIRQDGDGFLWMSTNKGLSRFDPDKELFDNLGLADGLQENEFNDNTSITLASGKLAFGGINGFNLFDPRSAFSNFHPPKTIITDFLLNNQAVPISAHGPLKLAIPFSKELRLGYKEKVFGFEFAAPDARAFNSTRYAYLLEGFDSEWQFPPSGRRFVTYTNLKPGGYVMRVKSANARGDFGEEAQLKIHLAPHPWLSTTAYFLYASTLLALVLGFILYQRRQQRILKELVEQRTVMLASRNNELRATDRIVSTINAVLQPEEVLLALTHEVYNHFPGADRVAYVLIDPVSRSLKFVAVRGQDTDNSDDSALPVEELQRLYAQALKPMAEGVYIAHDCGAQVTWPLMGPKPPVSLICLSIRIGQRDDGYLTIANLRDPNAFRSLDVDTLSRVRQHAISALAKARNLADLVTAQKALVDTAHATGMAELAMEVMHKIGTQTNNAKTSAQTIMESCEKMDTAPAFTRLADLFAPGAAPPDYDKVRLYLQRQAEKQGAAFQQLRGELERLDKHLQAITHDLYAQQKHIQSAKNEPLFLSQIVEEVLSADRYLLVKRGITIQRNYHCSAPVLGKPVQLKRVLVCLFDNALEALSAVEKPNLTVETRQVENWGTLIIRDNGKGIEAQYLDMVFRPGSNTMEGKQGAGLHYCANALKEMGGKICIQSDGLGKGTEVRCDLPLSS